MAEVQKTTISGELTQRFVEFVMMQAQNAALFLGQIPNPQTGQPEVNLEFAKMFIDQLVMIQEKTRGNLSAEESTVLRNALSNLQMAFVEASQGAPAPTPSAPPSSVRESSATGDEPAREKSDTPPAPPTAGEAESRKKFTKSYGA